MKYCGLVIDQWCWDNEDDLTLHEMLYVSEALFLAGQREARLRKE